MDPEVKQYFLKIISSFSMGLLWMFCMVTAGLYFELGLVGKGWAWYNALFYAISLLSFLLLLRYYYRVWRQPHYEHNA